MGSVLRSLLVWLMVLAMPLQGLAAAGMQHCAAAPERVPMAPVLATPADAHHDQHHHHHGPARALAVDHDHHQVDAAAAAIDASGAAAVGLSAGDHRCSACAACCAALGLPAAGVQVPAVAADTIVAGHSVTAVGSFVPAGLDRPPRLGLA